MKTLQRLIQEMEVIEIRGDASVEILDLAYDSRKVKEGDLFVAVRGTRQDGSRFVGDAIAKGARAVVTDVPLGREVEVPVVRVADARRSLAAMADVFFDHPSRKLQLIGITGTSGKTTTSLLVEGVLKAAGHSVGVVGTLGYRWGKEKRPAPMTTPESLDLQRLFHAMLRDGVSHVVMEVSSHALALGRVDCCGFTAAVFTNLSQDHLDFHETMEDYFQVKSELFTRCLIGCGRSVAVVNLDDPYGRRLAEMGGKDAWGYSASAGDGRVRVVEADLSHSGIRAVIEHPQGRMEVRSSLIGRFNLYNVLAATAAGLALGVTEEAVLRGIAGVCTVDGRLERTPVPEDRGFAVVVDYAHKPDAMVKALDCLREMTAGRIIVVFGCGGDRDRAKRPVMGKVAAEKGDVVVVTSDNPRSEDPRAIISEIEPGVEAGGFTAVEAGQLGEHDRGVYAIEPDRRKAIELALSVARPGDLVFVGGKGHETYQIIGDKVLSFDDRLVVGDYFVRQCTGKKEALAS